MSLRIFLLALSTSFLFAVKTRYANSRIPISEVPEICALDLSKVLIPESEFLGFIGEDKQRIYMVFDSL
ncbi:hypothetical protein [Croceimicrobium sp.]|uniref:hypothetical protein n=1 Tax=Croceimicrobium sp. TaxID=2828340 RepID=UPI003BACF7E8